MIVYRHADPRFRFLWEGIDQPPGRWHGPGEGPVQYFADTPDGAWAEFLRHEGISEESDLVNVRRALWAIELPDDLHTDAPRLSHPVLTGGIATYRACQEEARLLRARERTRYVRSRLLCSLGVPEAGRLTEVCSLPTSEMESSLGCLALVRKQWAGRRPSWDDLAQI